jgi:hypothetical protein
MTREDLANTLRNFAVGLNQAARISLRSPSGHGTAKGIDVTQQLSSLSELVTAHAAHVEAGAGPLDLYLVRKSIDLAEAATEIAQKGDDPFVRESVDLGSMLLRQALQSQFPSIDDM